jgi:hypothetical protein
MPDTPEGPMSRPVVLLLGLLLSAGLVACSGVPGAGDGDSSTAVVQQALALVAAKDLDGLTNLACEAQKDQVREQFDFAGGLAGGAIPGLDAEAMLDAVSFDTSGVTVTETSNDGTNAEVSMTGSLGFSFDEAKLRDVLVPILAQQNLPTDDAAVDAMLGAVGSMAQDVPLNETVALVKENGAWKICEADFGG